MSMYETILSAVSLGHSPSIRRQPVEKGKNEPKFQKTDFVSVREKVKYYSWDLF